MAVCVCVFGLNQTEYKIKKFYEFLSMEIMTSYIYIFLLLKLEASQSNSVSSFNLI